MKLVLAILLLPVIGCAQQPAKHATKNVTHRVTIVKHEQPDLKSLAPVLKESVDAQ